MEFGYWKIRGLAGGIRALLEYCDADWKDNQYEVVETSESSENTIKVLERKTAWDASQWFDVKKSDEFQKNFIFPNLPWLKDGDVYLTQSQTIFKYIARKFKMGQNLSDTEAWRVDLAMDQVGDMRMGFFFMLYDLPTHPFANRETFCKTSLQPQLVQLNRFIGDGTYLAGETLTYADFMTWEVLDHLVRFDETLFNGLDNIKRFKATFEALPKVKAFMAGDKFMVGPIVNKMASWGGDAELKKTW